MERGNKINALFEETLKLKIAEKIKEQNLNIGALEKKANLSKSAVRSILEGTNKNPGIRTLYAIAEVLNLSLDEAVGFKHTPNKHTTRTPWEEVLFKETTDKVIAYLTEKNYFFSVEDVVSLIEKIYIYSWNNGKQLDDRFMCWLINDKMDPSSV